MPPPRVPSILPLLPLIEPPVLLVDPPDFCMPGASKDAVPNLPRAIAFSLFSCSSISSSSRLDCLSTTASSCAVGSGALGLFKPQSQRCLGLYYLGL